MTKSKLAAVIVFTSVGTASAGGLPNSLGMGAEVQLSGLGGVSLDYDTGKFHVGGFFGFDDPNGGSNETIELGGRFFYHIASTASSDFGLGGGLGFQSENNPGNVPRTTSLYLEPGFQIRAFIVPNVALSFTGGISIGTVDASLVQITGGVTGSAGIHYYF
jgi:hypothetical protein